MKVKLLGESTPETPKLTPKIDRVYLESIWGNITRHGIKVMADGNQYVIHCLTGEALLRHDAQPFMDAKGNPLWVRKSEKLGPLDRPSNYRWRNPGDKGD